MRNIVIVDPVSTGANFVEDAVRRGFNPVVLTSATQKDGTIKEMIRFGTLKAGETPDIADILYSGLFHRPVFLEERGTYEETLQLVRGYAPAAASVAHAPDGAALWYETYGPADAPTLLVLHGGGVGTPGEMAAMLDALRAAGCRLLVPWTRGHGRSALSAAVKRNPAYAHIPIVAQTADVETGGNFDMSHFDGVILKPLTKEKLANAIQRILADGDLPRGGVSA
jgi:hypothetical protein